MMSRLLKNKADQKVQDIKLVLEDLLKEFSQQDRNIFSQEEIENLLLDIYNLVN